MLNRRCAPPARQQRCVQVHAAAARPREHPVRQQQAVSNDDEEIGGELPLLQLSGITQRLWLLTAAAERKRRVFDCGEFDPSATAARTIRLREHEPDVGVARAQTLERRHRECRSARKSDADRVGQVGGLSLGRYFKVGARGRFGSMSPRRRGAIS